MAGEEGQAGGVKSNRKAATRETSVKRTDTHTTIDQQNGSRRHGRAKLAATRHSAACK
jgi:hypothetical protein